MPSPCGRTFDGGMRGFAISHSPSGTIQLHVPWPMLSRATQHHHIGHRLNTPMSEGLFTLAGTLLGGLIGAVGTIGAARIAGRDQRRNQYEQWRREVRRNTYGEFIATSLQAHRRCNDLHIFIHDDPESSARREDDFKGHISWNRQRCS